MNIRTKLLLLALGSQFMMACAILVYVLAARPIEELQKENAFFQQAAEASEILQGQAGKLAVLPLRSQYEEFKKAQEAYRTSIGRVRELKTLPTINDAMKEAVESVGRLEDMTEGSFRRIDKGVEDLIADLAPLGLSQSEIAVQTIITRSYDQNFDEQVRNVAQFHVSSLFKELRKGDDVLSTTSSIIKEKRSLVAEEIAKIKARGSMMVAAAVVSIFVLVTTISVALATDIANALLSLRKDVEIMSTGNLTGRFRIKRRDDIGRLGADLDKLLGNFNRSIGQIQTASSRNRTLRTEVLEVATAAGNTAVEIEANSESIRERMGMMDRMIGSAELGTAESVRSIEVFNGRLVEQDKHIADTVSAVTQMLASIETIDRVTDRDRLAAEALVAESDESKEVIESAFERVAEISDSVSAIQEMAEVIAGIASQTNILAMNAAIEAAHAGEFGKGFAVVADEIGKLAAASALNSDEITKSIAAIVARIEEASASRENASRSFAVIADRIRSVSDSISEIYGGVNEMQSGSRQILLAMENMREDSGQITEESAKIERTARDIGKTMDELGRVSHEVTSNIEEISLGIRMIATNVRDVAGHAERLAEIGGGLDTAIATFTTSEA